MKIKVAQYIADFLVKKGVEHMFTVTGGGAMHLNDAFGHKKGLTCIYNHHEQACAMAAEGYARYTGKIAAVCVTSGPGGTNAITGVVGGWQDSIPMFIISGQVKRETTTRSTDVPLRQLGDQEFQIVDCVKHMTKYAEMVTEPAEIRYHLEKAWYLANHGRKGPVWLDIPVDVQAARIETDKLGGFEEKEAERQECPKYDSGLTAEVFSRIRAAKRPVILAGTGVRLSGAYDIFRALTDRLGIPVVTAWNAHDLLEDEYPYYCGRPGSVGTRGGNFVVQNSDLLIVLGCRMNIRQISYNYKEFAKHAYKIVVDIDAAELQKPTVRVDLPIHADLREVMREWLECAEPVNDCSEWLAWCRDIHQRYPAVLPQYYDKPEPVNPYVFIQEMSDYLGAEESVVTGNGAACVITFQAMRIKKGQRLFTNSGCAAMGYGFPASIGVAMARNGKRVVCIDGDGSFQMNIQELQTVVYHQLNLKIIIINNNGYHSIRQTQKNLFEPPLVGVCDGTGISFPSFEKLAWAYGLKYVKITRQDAIAERMDELLHTEGPVLCEVVCDPEQNFEPKLSSKVQPDGTIISPEIDDMFPFLPREEYEANKISD
ncbi:MAG: thiamine pyrophosphate-binding protein [Roseburia sp.]|nr:thiamine pyrophosphate-binding protein [Roseburia sp.]